VYVHQDVGSNVSALLGQWTVPDAPDEGGATLFTFTGLQNIDWVPPQPQPTQSFDIIQPVLQYGSSSAGGVCPCFVCFRCVVARIRVLYVHVFKLHCYFN